MIQVLFHSKFESILRDCVMITSGSDWEIDISVYKLCKFFLISFYKFYIVY